MYANSTQQDLKTFNLPDLQRTHTLTRCAYHQKNELGEDHLNPYTYLVNVKGDLLQVKSVQLMAVGTYLRLLDQLFVITEVVNYQTVRVDKNPKTELNKEDWVYLCNLNPDERIINILHREKNKLLCGCVLKEKQKQLSIKSIGQIVTGYE